MADKKAKEEHESRKKKQGVLFSNYEKAVTVISSFEAWFQFRWGPEGKEGAGLLESFNRFPNSDGLTPDFEARFFTPYVIWGEHKKTIQPVDRGRDDVDQIIKYAARRPLPVPPAETPPNYDVVLIVNSENDDVAAEAVNAARQEVSEKVPAEGGQPTQLAPTIVLGCHRDPDTSEGEWYTVKWRPHHNNCRFSNANVSTKPEVPDLNKLIVESTYHPIPVSKPALNLASRNPFVNDSPPPMYTVVRVLIPAICELMSDEDRDQLQWTGKIQKSLTIEDVLGTDTATLISPQPRGFRRWIQQALDFLASDLRYARKVQSADSISYFLNP